ncbi:MAG: anthranilate phosphoribosyltransferase [Candidatus Hydrogenedens sp.]
MLFSDIFKKIVKSENLSREDYSDALSEIMEGNVSEILTASFLTALSLRPYQGEELAGLATAMRKFALPINIDKHPIIDTCGTGGDRKGTFNISTTTAFVCAGADIYVAKHGNRSATSSCGSADVLEHLGVVIDLPPDKVVNCIEEVGIGFLFARRFHPAMKNVAKVRSELPFPTVFNLLGPLSNPVSLDGQIIGIFAKELLEPIAKALQKLGIKKGFVVWGNDGVDELSISDKTDVIEISEDDIKHYQICPEDFGLLRHSIEHIKGGTLEKNAEIVRSVLMGEKTPYRDAVLLNAIFGILVSGRTSDWKEAICIAEEAIDSGKAMHKLENLILHSRQFEKETL